MRRSKQRRADGKLNSADCSRISHNPSHDRESSGDSNTDHDDFGPGKCDGNFVILVPLELETYRRTLEHGPTFILVSAQM